MTRIVLVDNYDSFTWNLVHLFGSLGADITVYRNDAVSVDAILADAPDGIILSPGPCTPNEAGICLGLQAIGQAYGGEVVRAPVPMHGKVSSVRHRGTGLFRGINGPFQATRYHSLIVRRDTCPAELAITAETEDGIVMGAAHAAHPVHGVQFHPESIMSQHGSTLAKNFLDLAAAWNKTTRANAVA